ncbi:13747_t:CDS:2, partial [Dentiscutata heterogama]
KNNEVLYAHSIILRIRSPYFQTAFSEKWTKKIDDLFIFEKPNISMNAFEFILRYIYTAEINLESYEGSEILEFLDAADELNLLKVVEYISKYMIKNKSIFLHQDPVKILQPIYKHKALFELKDFCINQICASPDFTHLEKILHNLIPFIRFHHICSNDYYHNVKPFKKILPKSLREDIERCYLDPYTKPEFNVFKKRALGTVDSVFINNGYLKIFAKWISRKENVDMTSYIFKLIFRGSRDCSSHKTFHQKCDGMGATIVKGSDRIVGGYDPLDWKMEVMGAEWKITTESFIFTFDNYKKPTSAKLSRVCEMSYVICCDSNYGPIFGRYNGDHHDLVLLSTGIWMAGPSSYPNIVEIPSIFQIDDYEVFQVVK